MRELHQAPNPTHLEIEIQGTTIEMRGETTLTRHLLLIQMDIFVTCSLNFVTRSVDYQQNFLPLSYFQPFPTLAKIPHSILSPMNIISWNVRGVAGTNFKRIFKEMVRNYNPNLVLLTKTRLSGDRANSISRSLGYERFVKVDAMGFSKGIWVLWNQ